jgi:hypothetical protein
MAPRTAQLVASAEQAELIAAVDHWCPSGFDDEPFTSRLFRAFLHARACVSDQRRALAGQQPIRPLDSYPEEA